MWCWCKKKGRQPGEPEKNRIPDIKMKVWQRLGRIECYGAVRLIRHCRPIFYITFTPNKCNEKMIAEPCKMQCFSCHVVFHVKIIDEHSINIDRLSQDGDIFIIIFFKMTIWTIYNGVLSFHFYFHRNSLHPARWATKGSWRFKLLLFSHVCSRHCRNKKENGEKCKSMINHRSRVNKYNLDPAINYLVIHVSFVRTRNTRFFLDPWRYLLSWIHGGKKSILPCHSLMFFSCSWKHECRHL